MRIGIEGQRLYRKKKHGMDMLALELIKNLQTIDSVNEYVIFVKPDIDNTCIPKAPNFKIVELGKNKYHPIWEQITLPRAAEKEGCDILHCTSNTGPIYCKVPIITVIHDIIYLESFSLLQKRGTWYQKFGNLYRRYVVPIVAQKSKRVITVSNFEKELIKNNLNLGDNLVSIYNGVGEHFTKITDKKLLDKSKSKYNLPDNFLIFIGNTDPKKNTPNVLTAYADYINQSETKYKLVIIDFDEKKLIQLLNEIGHTEIRKEIITIGYVPNNELPAIINQSKLFLYPSLRESFGIPILEAMACGVPVITSNTSSMPEIAGNAAEIVDPTNPLEIRDAINRILKDDSYNKSLVEKGIERAKMFSWKVMAENYLELYKQVFEETKKISS
ncbi:MAG: glycosyltransferase family 1 protein [Paludibacter sp.]